MLGVVRKLTPAVAAALVLFSPGVQAAGPSFLGTWVGTASQVGRDGGYAVVLTIDAKSAQTSYPDEQCLGNLTRVGASGNYVFYSELIIKGRFNPTTGKGCVDGTITLARAPDKVLFGWFGMSDGAAVVAFADLTQAR